MTVDIITTPEEITSGGALTLNGGVRVDEFAYSVVLRFASLEAATIEGPAEMIMNGIEAGEAIPFSVPVGFGSAGRGAVLVTAEVRDETGAMLYSAREGLFALFRPTGVVAGRGGFLALDVKAVDEDIRTGRLSGPEAEAARKAASTVVATVTDAAPRLSAFSQVEQELNALLGAPRDGYVPADGRGPDGAPAQNITIQGTMSWTDENGVVHPAWGINVDIWDDDTFGDEYLTTVVTDMSGNYVAVVDDDDGIGQGDRDIYVEGRLENTWVRTVDVGDNLYAFQSGIWDETPGGSVLNYSPTATNTGTGPSVSVFEAATWIAGYVAFDAEGAAFGQVEIQWPNGDTGSFYDGRVRIEEPDRWDWDTIHHEWGHYAMDVLNIENNPGGAHNIGDCAAMVRGSKDEGNRLAWGEGWPTYFGTSGQFEMSMGSLNVPRVGDAQYDDLEDGSVSYSMESQDNNGRGEDNEVAVQRLLWDLYDSNSDGRDQISRSDNSIWNAIKAAAGSPHILSTYWGGLRSGQSNQNQLLMGEIATDHQIGPNLDSPAEGAVVSPSSRTFTWQAEVGCPSSYDGDQFDLKFFDANTFALLLTIPGLTSTSHVLTDGQLAALAAVHDVIWAVEGRHVGTSPSTGPYLGESFAIVVNTPPVADAGPDQPDVECTSYTTTPVQLDGTGSSDPDGDSITWSWSAPGVVFNNPNSATPIGQFPDGATVVTLTVSDGIAEDTDTVVITVVDTTPPVITCPADITVECTSHQGTPRDDAQLIPFFAGVSAVDVCDPDPVITDDAPGYFPLGPTTVTFTATDEDGNASDCTAVVTVVDTTPPEITVDLNRYSLWPPNHKMADIEATVVVTDICDPNPTFVLTSITSDEADNGLGDGDTSNDIQDADFGTPDVSFRLRSERMGGEDGRVYCILYTASDMSGNTSDSTVCVTVPHDQSGNAMPSSGFTADGTWVLEGAGAFRLILFTGPGFDVRDVVVERAYVGNLTGVIRPAASAMLDANGDGTLDLLLDYSTAELRDLRASSKKVDTLGLHYVRAAGDEYLVPDVFALGAPMEVIEDGSDERTEDLPVVADGLEPGLGQPGTETAAVEDGPGLFVLPQGGHVQVDVYDVRGRRLVTLADQDLGAGRHEIRWDGRDENGRAAPSGVYFYRVLAPGLQSVRKIVVAR